jgi:hypothetical protein
LEEYSDDEFYEESGVVTGNQSGNNNINLSSRAVDPLKKDVSSTPMIGKPKMFYFYYFYYSRRVLALEGREMKEVYLMYFQRLEFKIQENLTGLEIKRIMRED